MTVVARERKIIIQAAPDGGIVGTVLVRIRPSVVKVQRIRGGERLSGIRAHVGGIRIGAWTEAGAEAGVWIEAGAEAGVWIEAGAEAGVWIETGTEVQVVLGIKVGIGV